MVTALRNVPVSDDDSTLVGRMVDRDADALAELYDRYGRVVFGVLQRMLPGPEAAEEVCQDVFHRFWRSAASYRGDRGGVRTWLLAIARNAAIDWRRTRGKRVERDTALDGALPLAAAGSVEEVVGERLRAQRMRSLVATLPTEQRRCIELAYWGGLSQQEVAERTATPLGTVKSRIRLGMAKLRAELAAELRDHAEAVALTPHRLDEPASSRVVSELRA